ncbi:MAG: fluoride efflux transporter FluC [Actinomycetota bacterium]
MTAIAFIGVCVLGAWARSGLIAGLNRPSFPVGTLVVNCIGSAVAGALHARFDGALATVAVTGALGAFTTFSTFSVEVADDLNDGRRVRAAAYTVATVVGSVAAAALGAAVAA